MEAPVPVRLVHADDIRPMTPKDSGDYGQRSRLVLDHDTKPRGATVRFVPPGEVDPIRVDAVGQGIASDRVNLDSLAFAPQAHDPVAGDRVAALGKLEGDAGG